MENDTDTHIKVEPWRGKALLEVDLEDATLGDYDEFAKEFIVVVTEQQAIKLIHDLIKVFNLAESNFIGDR